MDSLLGILFLIGLIFSGIIWHRIKYYLRTKWDKAFEPADTLKKTQQDISRISEYYETSKKYRDLSLFGVCFSRFALLVAYADGEFTKSEYNAILHYFRGGGHEFIKIITESIQRDISNPKSIDWDYNLVVFQTLVSENPSMEFDSLLFDALIFISAADNKVSKSEMDIIFHIMSQIGWANEKINAFFSTAFGFHQIDESEDNLKLHACELLGVKYNATIEEIKSAYRKMAKQYHPDMYATLGEESQKLAENRFKSINEAYVYLINSYVNS